MIALTHRPPYSVSGQSGKPLSAARVSLESIGVQNAKLDQISMGIDRLTWFQRGGPAPEYGQEMTLWDADGNRILTGNCTASDPEWDGSGIAGYDVTISGPWWWLDMAQLTGLVADSTGEESERPTFVFPAQDLSISIRSLIDRMQLLGVPLRCGEICPTFPVPQMTMQATTAASALRDMLGWIPDAMTRVRYDVDGLPALDVFRRASAHVITLETGTDSDQTGIPRLRARRSLRPESVRVQSAELDADGNLIFTEQTAGDPSGISGVLGRQLIAVSGPGRPDFRDPQIDLIRLRTVPITEAGVAGLFYQFDPELVTLKFDTGIEPYEIQTGAATFYKPTANGFTTLSISPLNTWWVDDVSGAAPTGWHALVDPGIGLPDWWEETGVVKAKIRIRYRMVAGAANGYAYTGNIAALGDFQNTVTGGTYYFSEREVELVAIAQDCTLETIFVRPRDRFQVTPVADLADNLFAAQDWTPYDGEVPLIPGAAIPLPGNVLNIRGALPEWATMQALIVGASMDIATGSGRLIIGSPSRLTAGGLVDRFARPLSGKVIDL